MAMNYRQTLPRPIWSPAGPELRAGPTDPGIAATGTAAARPRRRARRPRRPHGGDVPALAAAAGPELRHRLSGPNRHRPRPAIRASRPQIALCPCADHRGCLTSPEPATPACPRLRGPETLLAVLGRAGGRTSYPQPRRRRSPVRDRPTWQVIEFDLPQPGLRMGLTSPSPGTRARAHPDRRRSDPAMPQSNHAGRGEALRAAR
jgi:hypothetical protein